MPWFWESGSEDGWNWKTHDVSICLSSNWAISAPSSRNNICERVFSITKIIKTELCNKMDDDWLIDLMIWCNEIDIFKGLDDEAIMKRFQALKHRRMNLPWPTYLVLVHYVHLIVYLPISNIFIQLWLMSWYIVNLCIFDDYIYFYWIVTFIILFIFIQMSSGRFIIVRF